jgi:hypothetical protein
MVSATNHKTVFTLFGLQDARAEAESFEPLLNSLADWFIDNPAPSWQQQLWGRG